MLTERLIVTTEGQLVEIIDRAVDQRVRLLWNELGWSANKQNESPDLVGIETAGEITQLAKQTLYGLVSRRLIPHKKIRGKLWFSRKELLKWITDGDRPTVGEIYAKTGASLATKNR